MRDSLLLRAIYGNTGHRAFDAYVERGDSRQLLELCEDRRR